MKVSELEAILGQAVRIVGSRLGIDNAEFYSVDELRECVRLKDNLISQRLEAFVAAYWQWFDFHRRIEAQGKAGNIDSDETGQLQRLIKGRDVTRQELLAALPAKA